MSSSPALNQFLFRIRTDGGAVDATPTWAAAENANATIAVETLFRIRLGAQNTGTASAVGPYVLRCSKNGGAYTAVTTSTGATLGAQSADASTSADETAITVSRLTGGASSGVYDETGSIVITQPISTTRELEYGLILKSTGATVGDTFDFRIYNSTTAFTTYTQTARVTVPEPAGTDFTPKTDDDGIGLRGIYNVNGNATLKLSIQSTDEPILVGDLVILAIAVDNATTTNGDEGAVTAVADDAGNAYQKALEYGNGAAGALNSTVCSVWWTQATAAIVPDNNKGITASFSSTTNRDAIAMIARSYAVAVGKTVSVAGTNSVNSAASLDVTTANIEHVRVRAIASQQNAAYGIATKRTAGWKGWQETIGLGGSSALSQTISAESRIVTGTSSASAPASGAAVPYASVYVAFKAAVASTACFANSISSASSITKPAAVHVPLVAALDLDLTNPATASQLTVTRGRNIASLAENLAGTWTSFAVDTARITDQGLLVEEPQTNSIRNNSMQGAAIGIVGPYNESPNPTGLPDFWGHDNRFMLPYVEVMGLGTTQGLDYIDIRFRTTNTGDYALKISFDGAVIPAASGDRWVVSCFLALVGGSLDNVTSIQPIAATYDNPITAWLETISGGEALPTIDGKLRRYFSTGVLANASSALIQPMLNFSTPGSTPLDFTLRIASPQLEHVGSNRLWPTSPIRTTNATVMRGDEWVTVNNIGTWFTNTTAGTVISEVIIPGTGGGNQFHFSFESAEGYHTAIYAAGNYNRGLFWRPTNSEIYLPGQAAKQLTRVALAWGADDTSSIAANGIVASGSHPDISPFAANALYLGEWTAWWDNALDGYVRRVRYYPTKLPDDLLKVLTRVAYGVNEVRSRSSVSRPTAATAAPVVNVPCLANDVSSASNVGQPSVQQRQNLLANDVASTSNVNAVKPALRQLHGVLANDVLSASTVTKPNALIRRDLLANDVASTSSVSQPNAVIRALQGLLANDVQSASSVGQPSVQQRQNLLANDVASGSSVTKPTQLRQLHNALANDVASASKLSAPILGILGTLDARDIGAASNVTAVQLRQAHGALANDLASPSLVSRPSTGAVVVGGQLRHFAAGHFAARHFMPLSGYAEIGLFPVDSIISASFVSQPEAGIEIGTAGGAARHHWIGVRQIGLGI